MPADSSTKNNKFAALLLRSLKSYAFRVRLMSSMAIVLIWMLLGVLWFASFQNYVKGQLLAGIDDEFDHLINFREKNSLEELVDEIHLQRYTFSLLSPYLILIDKDGTRLAGNIEFWPQDLTQTSDLQSFQITRASQFDDSMTREMLGRVHIFSDQTQLLVASSTEIFAFSRSFFIPLAIGAAITMIALISIASIYIALGAEREYGDLNRTIRRIMDGDLSERIPIRRTTIQSRDMANSLNKMLDRIELLMDDVRRVSDNIAHDLNTPLARLRNDIQKMLRDSSVNDEPKLQQILQESNQILETFNALLRVGKIESGGSKIDKERFDLAKVVLDVFELYEPLAQERNIEIQLPLMKTASVIGDRNLIFQVIANLVDNAIKYSESNSEIKIHLNNGISRRGTEALAPPATWEDILRDRLDAPVEELERENYISVVVADQGIGLPTESHKKIFQRFYREEQSRNIKPGNGLGLSMVMAVMRIHRGGIYVASDNGLRMTLALPTFEATKT